MNAMLCQIGLFIFVRNEIYDDNEDDKTQTESDFNIFYF